METDRVKPPWGDHLHIAVKEVGKPGEQLGDHEFVNVHLPAPKTLTCEFIAEPKLLAAVFEVRRKCGNVEVKEFYPPGVWRFACDRLRVVGRDLQQQTFEQDYWASASITGGVPTVCTPVTEEGD